MIHNITASCTGLVVSSLSCNRHFADLTPHGRNVTLTYITFAETRSPLKNSFSPALIGPFIIMKIVTTTYNNYNKIIGGSHVTNRLLLLPLIAIELESRIWNSMAISFIKNIFNTTYLHQISQAKYPIKVLLATVAAPAVGVDKFANGDCESASAA